LLHAVNVSHATPITRVN